MWGNFDSGSTVVRDPRHPHYNSEEQLPKRCHSGKVFAVRLRLCLTSRANNIDDGQEISERWLKFQLFDPAASHLPRDCLWDLISAMCGG